MTEHCPNCGHRADDPTTLDERLPGLVGIIRGEAGGHAKALLTVALCVLAVLFIVATLQAL